jgi:LuxR family maltose regulon positive regulatory protein
MLPRLETKLHPPRVADDFVPRPRLLDKLNSGLSRKLTLVSAPAGFGKTSLIASWIASTSHPVAWLSLDEDDNTLIGFVDYLTATIGMAFPTSCDHTQALLQGAQDVPVDALATSLINEVSQIAQDFALVLDDYHCIEGQAIHDVVTRLIRHQPRKLHLVIVSRTDPPLSLASLRAAHITEIRASDLRFSRDETQAFLTNATGMQMAADVVVKLDERIEGWAAGLRLALLTLRDRRDPTAYIETGMGADRHIMAYLLNEVLNRLKPAFQHFLLCTSILDRFCAGLFDAIGDAFDSGEGTGLSGSDFITWLDELGLFLTPLDHEWRWFRFHHLFQQLLRHRLNEVMSPEAVARLHVCAGAWFDRHGMIDEALDHFLTAGEPLMAARVVERHAHDALNAENFRTLLSWLVALPQDVVDSRAGLSTIKALLTFLQGKYTAAQQLIDQAAARAALEQRLQPECATVEGVSLRRRVAGEVSCLKVLQETLKGDASQCIAQAEQALRDLPQDCAYMRSAAVSYRALAQQRLGQFDKAERTLLDLMEQYGDKADTYSSRIGNSLGILYRNALRFAQLKPLAQRQLALAKRAGLLASICWPRYLLAVVSYEWNELDDAIEHLSYIRDHRYGVTMIIARRALIALALAQQACGQHDDARLMHEMLVKYQIDVAGGIDLEAQALEARLALLSGQPDRGIAWAHGVQLGPTRGFGGDEIAHLTHTQLLIAEGTPQSVQQALDSLERLCQATRDEHSWYLHVQVLAQKALALDALGQRRTAKETLQEALTLARPAGLLRTFVDLGPAMERLLMWLAERGQADAHLTRILAAYPRYGVHGNGKVSTSMVDVVDLLTPREVEILRLLEQHLSNKQIAQRLVITPETVQRHASNIFAKLSVHNRRQAVARARAQGILN